MLIREHDTHICARVMMISCEVSSLVHSVALTIMTMDN